MNKEMSWVPVFDEDKDNYVPGQYQTKDIYQGENSLPMFDTQEECEQWCQNDSPFASPKVDEPKCNFPNCKCDVEVIPDGMSIKCSLTKPVQESYENKALKWYL